MKNIYYLFCVLYSTIVFFMCCYFYDESEFKKLLIIFGIINITAVYFWIDKWFNEKMKL